ncbi:hypothetical protein GCM10008014_55710 [Paenibacillus silvae]|uniref:Uncharacterized protein n=1 Tax=Paenibacillus silvae TaxID=1325358 RepID=A0ABQ1ZP84_9BACL|nr:hypothetical protein [Paenibacillus silvae]GGH70853.1 hypothetical protein GCM10008014_55710 [Paenibacillus silvae]
MYTIDTIKDQYFNQEHLEIQLDKLKTVYLKKTIEIMELEKKAEILQNKLTYSDQQMNGYMEELQVLQIQIDGMEVALNNARNRVQFELDYANRRRYYESTYDSVDTECFNKVLTDEKNASRVIISLDGMEFNIERASGLMEDLSEKDYVCLHFERDLDTDVRRIRKNNYAYKSEVQLLGWLKSIDLKPVLLVNSVQQTALLDLIDAKYIWYDICNHGEALWGEQADAKMQHFNLLDIADMVTFSDRKFKRYTLYRKDSMMWKPYKGFYEILNKIFLGEFCTDDK